MSSLQTMTAEPLSGVLEPHQTAELPGLTVLWSRDEPARIGEVLLVPLEPRGRTWIFGRGDSPPEQGHGRLKLYRQRPGRMEPVTALQSPRISREQLRMHALPSGALRVENLGRCPLLHDGREVERADVQPGDVLEVQHELLLLCLRRPSVIPSLPGDAHVPFHPFGEADTLGLVGESPSIWELRRQIAFTAARQTHVLVLGASGTGKELVARAIHALSARAAKPLISRNAATFPETLIDAELFGNARNYPNPGMADRSGLIGEADGSTLFLDEIGELPTPLQAHLLRVLDQGEYQRLGESTTRRSDLRLVAATNRPEQSLKHDVLARLRTRLTLPDLNARREDIPLITRYLLRRIAAADPAIAQRFMMTLRGQLEPRITPELTRALAQHRYTTNVRELEKLLWDAMSHSPGTYLDLVEGIRFQSASMNEATGPSDSRGGRGRREEKGDDHPGRGGIDAREARRTGGRDAREGWSAGGRDAREGWSTGGRDAHGAAGGRGGSGGTDDRAKVNPADIPPEVIQASLDRHQGVQDRVWRELGLPNRFVLYRLIKKHGLRVKKGPEEDEGSEAMT
jgi:two-component system nitrogen regulation response regulator GlnG/two-component system response regulator HydG